MDGSVVVHLLLLLLLHGGVASANNTCWPFLLAPTSRCCVFDMSLCGPKRGPFHCLVATPKQVGWSLIKPAFAEPEKDVSIRLGAYTYPARREHVTILDNEEPRSAVGRCLMLITVCGYVPSVCQNKSDGRRRVETGGSENLTASSKRWPFVALPMAKRETA
ncbi:uncharacterized protein SETTUDRAFT_35746 [Exserohilum turcica Et28A]|uniref:Uncharacterized protein n=1 Tax=Exserohilum turcicum (strain 28A) TaxID=671987 RepID=R0JHG5_EXST2|nr:uncharacterized protein SETTUDRAFT_35746 [Exserohilum turcica Et28A]EOA80838.1 hypothetical protein SETTUDRAFT_35746 [Exserohilum turcica Et28A]